MTLSDRSNSRTDKDRKSNRTSGSSSTRCPPSSVHSAPIVPYRPLGSPNTCELSSLLDDGSDQSDTQSLHGSFTQRRRHAVYFHRPPVYVPLQRPDANTFPTKGNVGSHLIQNLKDRDCCGCCQSRSIKEPFCGKCPENRDLSANVDTYHLPRSISEIGIGGYEEQLKCLDTNWVEEPFIVAMANVEDNQDGDHPQGTLEETLPEIRTEQDWPNFMAKQNSGGESSATTMKAAGPGSQDQPKSQNQPTMTTQGDENGAEIARTFSQIMSNDCARLRSYRDIRLGPDENWVIREGSLVICLDHKYTDDSNFQAKRPDQFDFVHGDVFVVCRMYGDLWALCAKVNLNSPVESSGKIKNGNAPKSFQSLGFLPLCAVTLAANFSCFMRRCAEYDRSSQEEPQTPGNGLPVTPPHRSHSLTVSSEIFEKSLPKQLQLPSIVFELCGGSSSFDEDGKEFEPLTQQPQETFRMGSVWKARSGQLERRMTLKRVWHRLTNLDSSGPVESPGESQQQTAPPALPPPALRRVATQRQSETVDQTKPTETVERSKTSEGIKTPTVTIQTEGLHKRRKSVRDLLFNVEERWKRSSDRGSDQSDKATTKAGAGQRENSQ
ncbi:hypothetical protein DTO166G4_6769 [Paecilomyces variotii]|nr:hypothetical protein DTO166G4_6769 [Paecilomyces variotii]KAJ9238667.1 hypothetical protein DTO166G5_2788 [Paecilomyces variotii]